MTSQPNEGNRRVIENLHDPARRPTSLTISCTPRLNMVYEIDGARFNTLEEFFDEISTVVIPGSVWGRNLDAFNDILRGGFGTPDGGFTIRWRNHALSQERLGYSETIKQLEARLQRCHPSNREAVAEELADARAGRGPTVFDWLVEIVREHGPDGAEAKDRVQLVLD